MSAYESGADDRSRTCDLLITNQLLYQLSYNGMLLVFPENQIAMDVIDIKT